MFTWICPKCGREVPPAYNDCPNCNEPAQAPAPVAAAAAPPEYQPPTRQNPEAPPPPPPHAGYPPAGNVQVHPYQPPPPPARGGLPTWLLTILFAFAFLGLGAGIYWLVGSIKNSGTAAGTPAATVESPAAKPGTPTSPLQKYIEVAGVRFLQDAKKKPQVKFVLINHSGAQISGLAGNVTIWGRTRKSEEEAAGTFSFVTDMGPWESKDVTAPLTTKLPMIELPDWQNVTTDVQITAPAASGGSPAPR